MTEPQEDELLEVRATVHLARLSAGEIVRVDPRDPYMLRLLKAGQLVPADGTPFRRRRHARKS